MTTHNPSGSAVVVSAFPTQSVGAGATVAVSDLDVRNFRYALVVINTGVVAATADGTLTITDSDASGGTYATMTDDGVNIGVTAQNAVMTVAAADDSTVLYAQIDLHQFGNFLKFSFTGGTGGATLLGITVLLTGPDDTARDVQTVYDANALKFDLKHRLKSESY